MRHDLKLWCTRVGIRKILGERVTVECLFSFLYKPYGLSGKGLLYVFYMPSKWLHVWFFILEETEQDNTLVRYVLCFSLHAVWLACCRQWQRYTIAKSNQKCKTRMQFFFHLNQFQMLTLIVCYMHFYQKKHIPLVYKVQQWKIIVINYLN